MQPYAERRLGEGHDAENLPMFPRSHMTLPSVQIYGWSQRRLCNMLLNSSFTLQMKWQMYVSFSWFIPGFLHAEWLWGWIREGGDEGADVLPQLKNVVLRKTGDLKESHVCFGCNQKSYWAITDLSLFL